jgi:hypothetical protein
MKTILFKLFGRASDFANAQPLLALFLGGALLAVFLSAMLQRKPAPEFGAKLSFLWMLYGNFTRLIWALLLVGFLLGAISVMRNYLRQTVSNFRQGHGRVTQANYNAVQTIWGAEQEQGELKVEIYTDEEVTERIESEDVTKPAVLRKKIVRKLVTGNPFVAARHDVQLKQNPRKKGSAYYGGYETVCHFTWKLKNPADTAQKCNLVFPLPAAGAMYDDLSATLNGKDVLPQMQLKDATLTLARDVQPNEAMDLKIGFKSRGVSFWYFQVKEAREIRDFTLALILPDLPKSKLNYPGGCMTPTDIKPTANGAGSALTFRLDHAISSQGMGIVLPSLPQPGATTTAVLEQIENAWLLILATLAFGMTLASVPHATLITILFATATAFIYGLLGDFSDLLFGFWGTAALILVPLIWFLTRLLTRVVSGTVEKPIAAQLLLFGIIYPTLAGLDSERQPLYMNLCALVLLAFVAWMLAIRFTIIVPTPQLKPAAT